MEIINRHSQSYSNWPVTGLMGNRTAERARHHPHASLTLSYTALQHRSHTAPPLPPTGRALQPTAGTTTTTSSQPSDTYWQQRPHAHKPTSNPRNRRSPTTPCHHTPYPPRPPQTRTRNTGERSPTTPPRPHRPPPPKGHLRHTGRNPSPHGRQAVLPVHPTRPPSGPRDPPGVEAGKKGLTTNGARRKTFSGKTPGKAAWTPSWKRQPKPTPASPGTPGTAFTPS